MNSFTKPNVNLPISLHDARLSEIQVFTDSLNKRDGIIIFIFENGFKTVNDNSVFQTGKASIKFSGIDFDFSHVYYCKGNCRHEISFNEFAKHINIKTNSVNVFDECYGYNLSKFNCDIITINDWHTVEIEIYHFNETLYEWECFITN